MNVEGLLEKIRENLKKPLITGVIGLVVGILIGLPVLGWGLFPLNGKMLPPYTFARMSKKNSCG